MANTSAYGTDYYRVVYTESLLGVVDGPYTSESMARRIGNSTSIEWKIQKLVPQLTAVENEYGEFEDELFLMWVDVES